ncbi:hypothetical protein [Nocardia sp. NPDC003345]
MDSKTKVAGPLAAAGAVSLGLVFIGACGIGQEDTYVPPPPIHSGPQPAEQARFTGTTSGVAQVLIPPSPTWRIAPDPGPRRTLPPEYQISVTSSTRAGDTDRSEEASEQPSDDPTTTRRVTLSATPRPTAPADPSWTTVSETAPEIAPAHTESPLPVPPAPGATPDGAGADPTTSDAAPPAPAGPTSTETPAPAPPADEPAPGTEPARTTLAPTTEEPVEPTSAPEPYASEPPGRSDTPPTPTPVVPTVVIVPIS